MAINLSYYLILDYGEGLFKLFKQFIYMNIAIIGSGNVGGALSHQFLKAGHQVVVGVKYPLSEKSMNLALSIGQERLYTILDAVKMSEVILFTVPADIITQLIPQMGSVDGKLMIDATNSIRNKPEPFPTAYHAIKSLTNTDRVVKCFNTTGYENILDPVYHGEGIDMFCAGDHLPSKIIVQRLAREIGFANCFDFGGDDKVELLEKLALSWINMAIFQKNGRDIAFKLIRR